MFSSIHNFRSEKIGLIFLLLGISGGLFVFSGSTAAFPAFHAATMDTIVDTGTLKAGLSDTPAFHIYGAMIIEIASISPKYIMVTPFLVFGISLTFYLLIHRLSGSHIIAGSFTAVRLISGSTGTPKHFLYSHGLARILFFSLTLLLLVVYHRGQFGKRRFAVSFLFAIATITLSYDLEAHLLLFLAGLVVSCVLFNRKQIILPAITTMILLLIVGVLEFGVNGFVYTKVGPLLIYQSTKIASIDKFLASYFGSGGAQLSRLYYQRPPILTPLLLIKYLIFGLVSSIFTILFFNRLIRNKYFPRDGLIPSALLGAAGVWLGLRLLIGSLAFDSLALPATIILLWLYGNTIDLSLPISTRDIAVGGIIALLVINIAIAGVRISHGGPLDRNISSDNPESLESFLHKHEVSGENIRTDVKTWARIGLYRHVNRDVSRSSIDGEIRAFEIQDVKLIAGQNVNTEASTLYILNFEREKVALMNWVNLRSWDKLSDEIKMNSQLDKVYSNGRSGIYKMTNKNV